MKIIVTGASGYVGTKLINYLLEFEHQILVVGREPDKLATRFPACNVSCYDKLRDNIIGYDALVHLAVMNNDTRNSLDIFREANLSLLQQVFEAARQREVRKFIYLSSFQISDPNTPYAISKLEADNWLSTQSSMETSIIRIPAVYSDDFRGRLSVLNYLPKNMNAYILHMLRAAKPIVSIDLVIGNIAKSLHSEGARSVLISDPIEENLAYKLWRFGLDWVFIVSISVFFGWLLILTWLLVRFSSSGPAIFSQQRVGYAGKTFTCYKFRTMKTGTKEAGTHDVGASAVTSVGAFLRRTKIDELPQIWNIAKGEITLIGPRPCLPVQHELIEERASRAVFSIKPGITGLAQIQGIDMQKPVLLSEVDQSYLLNRNIIIDISILFATFSGRGMRDGVAPAS